MDVSRTKSAGSADVYVGIAVLGHDVGYIECGHLMMVPPGRFVHVDWTRCTGWDDVKAGPPNASDTTAAEMDDVIHAIEKAGFPPASIQSWTAVAPVGWDGFNTGAKTLRIGLLLVDLGPASQAAAALHRFETAKGDIFDPVPANVVYSPQLYIAPDCASWENDARDALQAQAQQRARIVASELGERATFDGIDVHHTPNVLCPRTYRPQFLSARWEIPSLEEFPLADRQTASVHFNLSGRLKPAEAAQLPKDAYLLDNAYVVPRGKAFALPPAQRYAATVAASAIAVPADAAVAEFTYRGGIQDAPARIAAFAAQEPHTQLLQRTENSTEPALHLYVRVQPMTSDRLQALKSALEVNGFRDDTGVLTFVSDCTPYLRYVISTALSKSREKAAAAAPLLHARAGTARAAQINAYDNAACGISPSAPLQTLVDSAAPETGEYVGASGGALTASFSAGVSVAWALDGRDLASQASGEERSYTGSVAPRPGAGCARLGIRALRNAVESAIIDGAKIFSFYERGPLTGSGASEGCPKYAEETVTIL